MFNEYDDMVTVEEMQKMIGVGKNTAYNLLKEDKIKSFRIGRNWKIPKESVIEYVRRNARLQPDIPPARSC